MRATSRTLILMLAAALVLSLAGTVFAAGMVSCIHAQDDRDWQLHSVIQ